MLAFEAQGVIGTLVAERGSGMQAQAEGMRDQAGVADEVADVEQDAAVGAFLVAPATALPHPGDGGDHRRSGQGGVAIGGRGQGGMQIATIGQQHQAVPPRIIAVQSGFEAGPVAYREIHLCRVQSACRRGGTQQQVAARIAHHGGDAVGEVDPTRQRRQGPPLPRPGRLRRLAGEGVGVEGQEMGEFNPAIAVVFLPRQRLAVPIESGMPADRLGGVLGRLVVAYSQAHRR